MQVPSSSTIALLAILPLVAWRVYARLRRMVGRQRLSRIRPWVTLTIFPILVLMLAYAALPRRDILFWLAGGLLAGALLAVYGLRSTRFEPTPGGLFYTPNLHLGIVLSLLFVGRLIFRLIEVYFIETGSPQSSDFVRSPVTLSIFGLLAGYYIAYAIGLVRWRVRVNRAKNLRASQTTDA